MPARLDLWLSDTQEMVPRSKMYLALDDADQRRLIIAYLKSVSGAGGAPFVSNVAIFSGVAASTRMRRMKRLEMHVPPRSMPLGRHPTHCSSLPRPAGRRSWHRNQIGHAPC